MQDSILKFSSEELEILNDLNFFLLKHSATQKMVELFGRLEVLLKGIVHQNELAVEGVNVSSGKIFRGENYNLFPYVLLDYPRLFSRESIFAFRTMFWWGSGFSFTLHLQGKALEQFRKTLLINQERMLNQDIYFCVNNTPWKYHYEKENYTLIDELPSSQMENYFSEKEFIKLSKRIPLEEYASLEVKGKETLELFLSFLT